MTFQGFPSDICDFFLDLDRNNSRDWFMENKGRYEHSVLHPVKSFIEVIGAKLQDSSQVTYDTRTNGQGSILKLNRDLRFSKDKTPYHNYISALLWEGSGKKNLSPAYGFRIGIDGMGLMAGMYRFSKDQIGQYRDAILSDELGSKLTDILGNLSSFGGFRIGGSLMKKVPKGYDPHHPRAELLKHSGLFIHPAIIPPDKLSSAQILEIVYHNFEIMSPVQKWLVSVFES